MAKWVSASCGGEVCRIAACGGPAFAKVGEEIMHDDPAPGRHNLTAYVCETHFEVIFGKHGAHFRNRWIENRGGPSELSHNLISAGLMGSDKVPSDE